MILLHICLLFMTLLFTPFLAISRFNARRDPADVLAASGILAVALILFAALTLHFSGLPINALTLSGIHGCFFAIAVLISISGNESRQSIFFLGPLKERQRLLLPALSAAVLVLILLPYTHFTGIDTYKWQDLATSVRIEQSLPWIIHPLSLFGFTPRAYPPAHPVLLATVQILGNLGVDGGFGVVSSFIALLGFCSATLMARRFLPPLTATLAGLLYCLSPVFIRYAHWGTGRGLFLAVFPALIATALPSDHPPKKYACYRRAALILCLSLLLLLTHKVALAGVPLLLASAWASRFIPVPRHKPLRFAVLILFSAFGAAIVSPALLPGVAGIAGGLLKTSVSRFAWMIPLALIGLAFQPRADEDTAEKQASRHLQNFLFIAALPALALTFERQMYGALYALPLITIAAVSGVKRITVLFSAKHRHLIFAFFLVLSIIAAITTVVVRSQIATSPELRRAAQFLEQHDPEGPFVVHSPGITRTRIQAYVSGCPRFKVRTGSASVVQWPELPRFTCYLQQDLDAGIQWLRRLLSLSDTETLWYGNVNREYYFIINGKGKKAPANGDLIYDQDRILIFQLNR